MRSKNARPAFGQTFQTASTRHPEPVEPTPLFLSDIGEEGVVRCALKKLVEPRIGRRPHLEVSFGSGCAHSLDALLEIRTLFVGEVLRRTDEEGGVEKAEDIADLVDVPAMSPATE